MLIRDEGTTDVEAIRVDVRAELAAFSANGDFATRPDIAVSIGAAGTNEGLALASLMAVGDRRMYDDKRSDRTRLVASATGQAGSTARVASVIQSLHEPT